MAKFIDGFMTGVGWGAAGSLVAAVSTLAPLLLR